MIRMKHSEYPVLVLALACVLGAGCRKIVDYPDEPIISFTAVAVVDSFDVLANPVKRVTLTFHLTDGNGDMGLSLTDTSGPYNKDSLYYYNLFIREFAKKDTSFDPVPDPDGLKRFRIPDITPTGQNKTLIADISVTMEYPYNEFTPLPFNEFRYHFYVVDRSLNISNQDTSSVIVW